MTIRILGTVVVAIAMAGATTASISNPEKPPPGHTGGFGEPSCISCHLGNDVNTFGGSVTIEGLPDRFVRGKHYPITVKLKAEETEVAGFQITARFNAPNDQRFGESAGEIHPINSRVTNTIGDNGVSYAHHTPQGLTNSSRDSISWSMEWIAPSTGSSVVFHVAANSGNGDNSPLSDLVYTSNEVTHPSPR